MNTLVSGILIALTFSVSTTSFSTTREPRPFSGYREGGWPRAHICTGTTAGASSPHRRPGP